MAAVAAIHRADAVLGSDHSAFVNRELRAFAGDKINRLELPPYSAAAHDGTTIEEARGCGNAYVLLTSPELWLDQAKVWFDRQDAFFMPFVDMHLRIRPGPDLQIYRRR